MPPLFTLLKVKTAPTRGRPITGLTKAAPLYNDRVSCK